MYPVRTNFYNKDIMMIHYELLGILLRKTKDPISRKQIKYLIELYGKNQCRSDLPYDLMSWPNMYFGLSLSDDENQRIIALAKEERLEDSPLLSPIEIACACGTAFLNRDIGLTSDLKKINEIYHSSYSSPKIKNYLHVVGEETVDYLLSFCQTHCRVEKDKKIIFFDGNTFVLVDTTLSSPYQDDRIVSSDPLQKQKIFEYKK